MTPRHSIDPSMIKFKITKYIQFCKKNASYDVTKEKKAHFMISDYTKNIGREDLSRRI